MKCITCGNELLEGDCICSQCGSYIESTHTDNPSDNPSAYDSPYQSTTSEDSDSYQNPYKSTTGAEYIFKHAKDDKIYTSPLDKLLPTYTIERIIISIIAALCLYSFFIDFIKYDTFSNLDSLSNTSTESFKLFEFILPAASLLIFTFISLFGIFTGKKVLAFFSMIVQTVFLVYFLTFVSKSNFTIHPAEGYFILVISLVLLLILLSIEMLQLIRAQPLENKYK